MVWAGFSPGVLMDAKVQFTSAGRLQLFALTIARPRGHPLFIGAGRSDVWALIVHAGHQTKIIYNCHNKDYGMPGNICLGDWGREAVVQYNQSELSTLSSAEKMHLKSQGKTGGLKPTITKVSVQEQPTTVYYYHICQFLIHALCLMVFLPPGCLWAYVMFTMVARDRYALGTADKRVGPEDPLDGREGIEARAIVKSLQVDASTQTPDGLAVASKITFGPVAQPIGGRGVGWIDKPCKCFHANPQKACTGGIPPDHGFPKHFVGLCAYNHNPSKLSSWGSGANVSKTNTKGPTCSNAVHDPIKQRANEPRGLRPKTTKCKSNKGLTRPVVYGPKTSN